ncbi:MAG: hypothetical protein ACKPKO_46275, partial [Candidatus Fonsibacter sp.]
PSESESARRPPPRADSAQESSLTLEMARIRGLSEMWAVTGKCLMDWAHNWQDILDPLNVSNSFEQIYSVWDRLGFCLDEVAKKSPGNFELVTTMTATRNQPC